MIPTEEGTREFIMTHVVEAPRERVWAAWTQLEHLKRWFGPRGFTGFAGSLDLRPGGTYHYGLLDADGHVVWGKWIFREIAPRDRLEFVVSFSDSSGGEARHPMRPDWPMRTLSAVEFTAAGDKTTVTVHWTPLDATEEETKAFEQSRADMRAGWEGTFDKLDAYLAGRADDATLEKVYEIYIKTTPDRLWNAITDPESRSKYTFGVRVVSDWKTGSRYSGVGGPAKSPMRVVEGVNLVVLPPRKLVQTFHALWSDEVRREGESRVTWEIEQVEDSCRLTVTHDRLRKGANAELYGGWPMVLSGLKTLLETGQTLTTPGSLRWAAEG